MPIKQGNQAESALHQLVGRIERALDAKEYTHCVFFDIEGAFDNTTMDSIRTALDDWKVYRSVRNWIIALIKERSVWRSPCALRKLPMTPPPCSSTLLPALARVTNVKREPIQSRSI